MYENMTFLFQSSTHKSKLTNFRTISEQHQASPHFVSSPYTLFITDPIYIKFIDHRIPPRQLSHKFTVFHRDVRASSDDGTLCARARDSFIAKPRASDIGPRGYILPDDIFYNTRAHTQQSRERESGKPQSINSAYFTARRIYAPPARMRGRNGRCPPIVY